MMKKLIMKRVYISQKFDISVVLESAYNILSVEQFAPLSHCRLVGYNPRAERIVRSFENMKNPSLEEITGNSEDPVEFLLEYRADGQEFEIYEPGGATWNVFMVNLATMKNGWTIFVYSRPSKINDILRHSIAVRLHVKRTSCWWQQLSQGICGIRSHTYQRSPASVARNGQIKGTKTPPVQLFKNPTMSGASAINRPALNNNNTNGSFAWKGTVAEVSAASLIVVHESNSEDSSLSDGDGTLVESVQHRAPNAPLPPQFFHAIKLEGVDMATATSSRLYTESDSIEEASRKPVLNRKHDKRLKNLSSQTLALFSAGVEISVELGKELQQDEHKAKIYFMRLSELNNESARLPCVCEWIYRDSMTAATAKLQLVAKLHRIDLAKYKSLNIKNCRLWLKGGRSPIKIYTDDETLSCDIRPSAAMEFIIQECEDGVVADADEDSLTIFLRRWHPKPCKLDKFQEVTLNTELKELATEERREFRTKEKTRLERLGRMSSSRFSPRRERALKIYLDSPVTTASPPVDANSIMPDD
ncbi:Ubiquitin carboxyl-terminal hydrolase 47 [Eumeta japonica]|uniref:Ubiquitin carboxyl-terminal hydrolase 47 n=1 Tax=Eumeta variegata TaxID=151549 RepID=A0A4C1TA00_EUMVA|nr:Ubiquitin carboxyl-terminal hydrolase 47 [Eumeta japonica]